MLLGRRSRQEQGAFTAKGLPGTSWAMVLFLLLLLSTK